MKLLSLIIAPASVFMNASEPATMCSAALADTAIVLDDAPQEMARGTVSKIDSATKSFDIKSGAEGAKAVTISWNDATVFMLDGQVKKWDEVVKENAKLTITHRKGVATKVEGHTE